MENIELLCLYDDIDFLSSTTVLFLLATYS